MSKKKSVGDGFAEYTNQLKSMLLLREKNEYEEKIRIAD